MNSSIQVRKDWYGYHNELRLFRRYTNENKMNQGTYDQWLKDSLYLLIEAESKHDEDFTRMTIEVILKQTSLAIKRGLTIPPDLINYLVGRFDRYFDDLIEASKNTKNEVTAIPEKLAEALHLKNKRPKDHADTGMRLSILSRTFCDYSGLIILDSLMG